MELSRLESVQRQLSRQGAAHLSRSIGGPICFFLTIPAAGLHATPTALTCPGAAATGLASSTPRGHRSHPTGVALTCIRPLELDLFLGFTCWAIRAGAPLGVGAARAGARSCGRTSHSMHDRKDKIREIENVASLVMRLKTDYRMQQILGSTPPQRRHLPEL